MDQITVKRPAAIVFAAALGAFLATFNETFFNVALVPIMNDLNVNAATAQWLVTANMLVAAVFVPITGFLYKSITTKPLYLIAVGSLIVGCVVGYVAQDFTVLLIARIIQAIGAGMVPVICMNMTIAVAPKGRLGTYIGIVGAMTTLGPSSSPLISGIVLTFATWQMLFVVYGVLTLICFLYGAIMLEDVSELTHPKLDILSTVLVSVGLIGIMYGISTAFTAAPVVAAISAIIGIAAFVTFIMRQKRIENPLLDLRPFSSRAFNVGAVCVILSLMSVFSMNIIMPTFMQESLGFTALSASITLFPAVMCACIFAPIGGRIYDRFGIGKEAPGGMAVLVIFEVALAVLVASCMLDTPAIWLAVLYAPVIAGAQFVIGPSQSFALSRLPRQLNTHGVVILSTCFQIAGCVGTSLFVGVYAAGESASLASGQIEALASMDGFMAACILGIGIAVLGVIFGLAAGYLEKREPVSDLQAATPAMAQQALEAVMKRDAFTVRRDQSVFDALGIMTANSTSGLPVVDEANHPVGFIDSGDIVRYIAGEGVESPAYAMFMIWNSGGSFDEKIESLKDLNVMELATPHVFTAEYEGGMDAAARTLSRNGIKKVPITQDGVLIGVLSRSDLMRHFFRENQARA